MAKARSKKKAKSGSKNSSKNSSKNKTVRKAVASKSPKKVMKKAAPKKAAPKKREKAIAKPQATAPRALAPKATPRKPLPAAVSRALSQAEIEGLISRLPPPVQPVVKTLRKLVLEAAPEASELLEDGSPAYFARGVFARIVPSERSVLVKFLRGGALPSANELSGDGDSRSITLSSLAEIKEDVLRRIVREAVLLNLSTPTTVHA